MDSFARRFLALAALVSLGLVCVSSAHADGSNGLKYIWVGDTVYLGSASAVYARFQAAWEAVWPSYGYSGCTKSGESGDEPSGTGGASWGHEIDWSGPTCNGAYASMTVSRTPCTGADFDPGGPCEPIAPADCDTAACPVGTWFGGAGSADTVCNTSCNCKLTKTGSNNGTTTWANSGESCGASPPPAAPAVDQGEHCSSVGDGTYCASPTGDGQCGYLNDSYVCLNRIKPDECALDGAGGRLCGAGAVTTPPVPDNGTPGVPATPDDTITSSQSSSGGGSTSNTFNYYGAGTTSGSARDPGTTGAGRSSGIGSSPGEGPSEEDVGAETGGPATVASESHDFSTLDDSEVSVSGTCPSPPSVTVFGSVVSIDVITHFCELASMISGLVLVAAWLAAVLIVARGF